MTIQRQLSQATGIPLEIALRIPADEISIIAGEICLSELGTLEITVPTRFPACWPTPFQVGQQACMADLTQMLNASPDEAPEGVLFAQLYAQLQLLAKTRMAGEREGHTLNTNGLVHEAWLRVKVGTTPESWRDRNQFYAAATEAMRRILVESARRRLAAKRGGGNVAVPLDESAVFTPLPDERLLEVHEVLDLMEQENPTNAQIVKLRYFGGLNHDEIASLLEMSETSARRHWAVAKVWLYRALKKET